MWWEMGKTMQKAIFCAGCGNCIAITDGDKVKIQHRGRTILVHGPLSISCEKCGKDNRYDKEDLRRLCGHNPALSSGEKSDARRV